MSILKAGLTATLLLALIGCTANGYHPEQGQTIVDLHSTSGNEMIARRLNRLPASDFNSFQFTGGKHTLEIGLARQDYRGVHRLCIATLTYDGFQPNHHYSITESNTGGHLGIQLADNNGTIVAQVDKIPCL